MSVDHRALFERLAERINRADWDAVREIFTEDVVMDYPQSGEVFSGVDNLLATFREYPEPLPEQGLDPKPRVHAPEDEWVLTPLFTAVRVDNRGDGGTAMFRARYPDGSVWWVIIVYELRGDRMSKNTVFFAPILDPADWRAPFRVQP